MSSLTHFAADGSSRMVDVSGKAITLRTARAEGRVLMHADTLRLITDRRIAKGDVLEVARLAGIMATRHTSTLIPLCHLLPVDGVELILQPAGPDCVCVTSKVTATARTGVEMEALTAVSVACLTIYDMCKSVDREMEITGIRLLEKSGGRSGHFIRGERANPARQQDQASGPDA
jgi:cyclic pyranopterin phosphate synthase